MDLCARGQSCSGNLVPFHAHAAAEDVSLPCAVARCRPRIYIHSGDSTEQLSDNFLIVRKNFLGYPLSHDATFPVSLTRVRVWGRRRVNCLLMIGALGGDAGNPSRACLQKFLSRLRDPETCEWEIRIEFERHECKSFPPPTKS